MGEALAMGWVPIQVSDEGFPDLVCVRRGEVRHVEVKSPEKRNRITAAQQKTFATLRANGVEVHVCVTREDIRMALGPAPVPPLTPAQVADARSVLPPGSNRCRAGSDGDCSWKECPQEKNNRANYQEICPLYRRCDDY